MPQALAVDWSQVRTLALAIGVREAARRLELSEEAVMKRCSREGWLKEARAQDAFIDREIALKRERQGLSAIVRTPAEVFKQTGVNTRSKLAVAVEKQADKLAETDADELLVMAPTVKMVVDSAAKLHGWENAAALNIRLDVLASDSSSPVIDV
jgi:antitoxin component of MazEF toxin-antitoxin module